MCSIGDDNFEQEEAQKYFPRSTEFKLLENKCNKCRDKTPKIVLRHKDIYCRDCFLSGTTHKFKALLGKHRLIYPNDKVLVYHVGGHPSTALLHFLRSGLDLSTPKKLRFVPIFLYIEDKIELTLDKRKEILHFIKEEVTKQDFSIYFISLAQFLTNFEEFENILNTDECKILLSDDDSKKVNSKYDLSETNRNDVMHLKKREILLEAAKHLGCKCIITPEIAIDISSQLLTNVALGRGIHIPLDVGICDDRDPEVKIIRPLRLFEIKELIYYNFFNNLEPVFIPKKFEQQYNSVQNLMKSFVLNLQTNFPATISTIVRTGDKLALDKDLRNNQICALCKAPKENVSSNLSSAESTRFSHWVSTQKPDYTLSPVERYEQTLEQFNKSFHSQYCFACQRLCNLI